MATLSPAWKPIIMEGECAPFGTPLFQPVIDEQRAPLVAGGPLKLHVFRVYSRQQLWYSIEARYWISGFVVQGDSLYVQDGPVISLWDLRSGGSVAAINLATGVKWPLEESTEASENAANLLEANAAVPQPPDWVYDLPDDLMELHKELMNARRIDEWAAMLEEADKMWTEVFDPTNPPRVNTNGIAKSLGKWFGSNNERPDQATIGRARRMIDTALVKAAEVVFSAPVVRRKQLHSEFGGSVFVLGQDGTLYGMDNALTDYTAAKFDAPARAGLAIAEIENAAGKFDCKLYYAAADGRVLAIDGSRNPPVSLPGWPARGPVKYDRLLPLRYAGGKLFGGGIFGADFFVMSLDPAEPPILSEGAAGPLKDYDVAPGDAMAIASAGEFSRQKCYAAGAKARDRWGKNVAPESSYSLFWPGTGGGGTGSTPLVSFEINGAGALPPAYRVYLANTVDSTNPELTSATYPPAAIGLDSGPIVKGQWTNIPALAQIRCKPMVEQGEMYCVVRSAAMWEQFKELMATANPRVPSAWERIEKAVWSAERDGKKFPAALADIRLPQLAGVEALVGLGIASLLPNVTSAARAGLAHIADLAQPIRVWLCYQLITEDPDTGAERRSPLYAQGGAGIKVTPASGPPRRYTTDGGGVVLLSTADAGLTVQADLSDPCWNRWGPHDTPLVKVTTETVKLGYGTTKVQVTVNLFDP